MTMAVAALLAAIGWAVVVAASVIAAGRVRRRPKGSVSAATGPTGVGRPAAHLVLGDLLVGGFVGLATWGALLFIVNRTLRMTVFGAISVTYLILVVGLPLVSVAAVVAATVLRRRERAAPRPRAVSRPALVACVVGLLLAPVGFYATHIEPFTLDVERPPPLAVAAERDGEEPITVGVLTDLQTATVGERENQVVTELLAAQPDVILLPGDMVQGDDELFERELPALRALFNRLEAPGGIYLVEGDVDTPWGRMAKMVEGTDVRWLDDEVVTTTVRDRTVTLAGIGVDYRSDDALAAVERLETDPGDSDIRILVSHRPDPVLFLREGSRIDLQVSGHTHGGQVSLPFVGPLMTLSSVPRDIAAGGLNTYEGHPIYVGHGVGLEHGYAPQIRFGVRPNIGVLTITG